MKLLVANIELFFSALIDNLSPTSEYINFQLYQVILGPSVWE